MTAHTLIEARDLYQKSERPPLRPAHTENLSAGQEASGDMAQDPPQSDPAAEG